MDPGIITAIIGGSCALTSIAFQKILDIKCVKTENEDGSTKNYHCIPRCKKCIYAIPKNDDISNILKLYREPPNNWKFSESSKYTKKTQDNSYLMIVPKDLRNKNKSKEWQGNVIWFREFNIKSDTKTWYLEADLDLIKNNKCVKIFIKRFTNKSLHHLNDNCEYISAINGRNSFEADSKIGDILEETEIIHDEDGNAKKIKKKYQCTSEQIGIIVYSKTSQNLIPPNLGICNNSDIKEEEIIKKIEILAQELMFESDLIEKIKLKETSTCLIKDVYIGDTSLYIIN
jgi:hypothetical protein